MKNVILSNSIKVLDDYILGNGGLYRDKDIHDAWNRVKNYIDAKDKVLDAKEKKDN